MPPFTFSFPVAKAAGGPGPTAAQLKSRANALREDTGALTLTLTFAPRGGNGKGTFKATGTTDDLAELQLKAPEAVDGLPPTFGWMPNGEPTFDQDPEPSDSQDPNGGRRRSSSKRVRKVTRRRRHRKSSRKLRSKLL
jgi:hypothetical protein